MNSQRCWPTAVDLFAGCGGVTEALKNRHFRVVAAVDKDPVACRTFRKNHPTVRLYEKDVEDVSPLEIREELLTSQDLDLLTVCAPCQPFSSQGQKNTRDYRSRLILSTVRFAEILKPAMIFFENVPGLANARFSPILNTLRLCLEILGYCVGEPSLVDAANYRVPQRRKRFLLLAKRKALPPQIPRPVTPEGMRTTVRQAIGALPRLRPGDRDGLDPLHFARVHHSISLKRLSHIPPDGGSRFSLPTDLVLKCHEGHSGHPDVYGRMRWDDVAPTLTTGCTDITKGRFAHPEDHRAISLREAARLQTFKDTYQFEGNSSQIAIQIGNAVPVRFVEELCPTLRKGIRNQL